MMTVTVNDHQISKKSAQNPIFAPLDGSTMNQSFKSLNIPQSTDRHFFARTQRTAPKIDTICITNVSQYVCRIGVIQNGESIIFSPLTPQESFVSQKHFQSSHHPVARKGALEAQIGNRSLRSQSQK